MRKLTIVAAVLIAGTTLALSGCGTDESIAVASDGTTKNAQTDARCSIEEEARKMSDGEFRTLCAIEDADVSDILNKEAVVGGGVNRWARSAAGYGWKVKNSPTCEYLDSVCPSAGYSAKSRFSEGELKPGEESP